MPFTYVLFLSKIMQKARVFFCSAGKELPANSEELLIGNPVFTFAALMKKDPRKILVFRSLAGLVLISFLLQGIILFYDACGSPGKNQKQAGGYELTVFWQNNGPLADAGTKLLKAFSDFLPPASIRFPRIATLFTSFSAGISSEPVCLLFRILRTSICINAP